MNDNILQLSPSFFPPLSLSLSPPLSREILRYSMIQTQKRDLPPVTLVRRVTIFPSQILPPLRNAIKPITATVGEMNARELRKVIGRLHYVRGFPKTIINELLSAGYPTVDGVHHYLRFTRAPSEICSDEPKIGEHVYTYTNVRRNAHARHEVS